MTPEFLRVAEQVIEPESYTPTTAAQWESWISEQISATAAGYLAKPDWLTGHHNGEASISGDYAGRELLELVQNTADAAAEIGGHGRVRIEICEDGLCVANTGMPFRAGGIRSLMTAHTSDKPTRRTPMIGAKGLGFRSLLNWSTEPFVTSGVLEIGFSRSHAREQVRMLGQKSAQIARLIESSRVPPAPVLAFPMMSEAIKQQNDPAMQRLISRARTLRETYDTVVVSAFQSAKARQEAFNQLTEFRPDFLLFVEALDEIAIVEDGEERIWRKTPTGKLLTLEIITQEKTEVQQWVCTRDAGDLAVEAEKLGFRQRYEIAVATRKDVATKSGNLHCFFPTSLEVPFPALFHATLDLDSNRKFLNANSPANQIVLGALSTLYAKHIEKLAVLDPAAEPLTLLRRETNFPAPLQAFESAIYMAASLAPIIPNNGAKRVKSSETQVGPKDYGRYLPRRFFRSLARCRDEHDRATLKRLKVAELDPAEMVRALAGASLSLDERAKAIAGIARDLPPKLHDRTLLLDTQERRLTRDNSCFPPPSTGRPPALPRWARARFIHAELWQKICKEMPGNARERFDRLSAFGINEYNAIGVISALRRQAIETIKRGKMERSKVRREFLAALLSLRQTIAKDTAYTLGRPEVFLR
ncbi:hypothetical protein U5A82_02930 [Sphingobium sp. CR2-8]|uniref:sacsin N-terminal ATP-binding-like domain-containing protein n=1 Tax=Sphingobium sp. CR2-8 TaxID=1306534 RepID=UPI002DBB97D6|nr:hypothetical protein [Sphingobium sp. CR2-8]MEC3909462.1 hypothetical protein [Sphingobium sp. CR2-8]